MAKHELEANGDLVILRRFDGPRAIKFQVDGRFVVYAAGDHPLDTRAVELGVAELRAIRDWCAAQLGGVA